MLVHLAIVSEQLLPTVIPCLMHRPDRVVLVASRPMGGHARRLKTLLETEGFAVEERDRAPDGGMPDIRAYATALVQELDAAWAGAELVLNTTGGTKLMALGFVEVFRERADRIIYTDTAHGRIEVIHDRRTAAPQPEPMRDVLDVPRYLAVQGFRYQRDAAHDAAWLARMERRREVARHLARAAVRLSGVIAWMNGLAHRALDEKGHELLKPVQSLDRELHGEWRSTFDRFVQAGLVKAVGPRAMRFADVEAARFLGGGWLEEYAVAAVRDAGVHDVRMGVTGVWEGTERARNEFDVLACHRNRMVFIECKTLRLEEGKNDNDLAYKVTSLGKDVRGLFGATWVLSAQEPTPVLLDRAKQAGFVVIGPKFLGTLTQWVRRWKEGCSAA